MKKISLSKSGELTVRERLYRSRTSYAMLAPFTVLFLLFTIIPICAAFFISLTSFDMVNMPVFVGVKNYMRLFLNDEVFIIALKNTLIFAFLTGPVGYILSFLFAWCINEFGPRLRSVLTLIFYAPSLAGNVYFVWSFIFSGDQYGMLNGFLMDLGILTEPIQWLTNPEYNLGITIIVVIWMGMGSGFLAFVAGLQNLNKTYFEAAAIDGIRNRWQELRHVTLPQMGPQLLFGAVMAISSAFAVGYQCSALTGFPSTDYSTHTLLLHMQDFGTIRYEMGYASTVAVFLFALMLISWTLVNKLLRKFSDD